MVSQTESQTLSFVLTCSSNVDVSMRFIDVLIQRLERQFSHINFQTATVSDHRKNYQLEFTVKVPAGDNMALSQRILDIVDGVSEEVFFPVVKKIKCDVLPMEQSEKKVLIAVSSNAEVDDPQFTVLGGVDLKVSTLTMIRVALSNLEDENETLEYNYRESLFSDLRMGFYYVWVNSHGYVTNIQHAKNVKSEALDEMFRLKK